MVEGYKINNEYYCPNCAREYCLFNLCSVLSEHEMVNLMPTKKITTDNLVNLVNHHGGDLVGGKIHPLKEYDFSDSLKKIRYLSELKNLVQRECANYHEFSHPEAIRENSLYQ